MATVQRTMFAAQAMSFAQLFKSLLGPATLDTSIGPYRPELSTPEGESTGGGKQSVQHIKLVPQMHEGATVVMGSVDTVEKKAELRTAAGFNQMLERRFRGSGPMANVDSYDALLKKISNFMASQGVAVTLKDIEVEAAPTAPPARVSARQPAGATAARSRVASEPASEPVMVPSSAPKFMITVVTAVVVMAVALALMLR